ncbi:MAG: hypothetical protein ACXAD7_05955 [Candidatus Kariarchaeaceae archaeon]|jgi:hypothetical protein
MEYILWVILDHDLTVNPLFYTYMFSSSCLMSPSSFEQQEPLSQEKRGRIIVIFSVND